jgi:hypothetical protein
MAPEFVGSDQVCQNPVPSVEISRMGINFNVGASGYFRKGEMEWPDRFSFSHI